MCRYSDTVVDQQHFLNCETASSGSVQRTVEHHPELLDQLGEMKKTLKTAWRHLSVIAFGRMGYHYRGLLMLFVLHTTYHIASVSLHGDHDRNRDRAIGRDLYYKGFGYEVMLWASLCFFGFFALKSMSFHRFWSEKFSDEVENVQTLLRERNCADPKVPSAGVDSKKWRNVPSIISQSRAFGQMATAGIEDGEAAVKAAIQGMAAGVYSGCPEPLPSERASIAAEAFVFAALRRWHGMLANFKSHDRKKQALSRSEWQPFIDELSTDCTGNVELGREKSCCGEKKKKLREEWERRHSTNLYTDFPELTEITGEQETEQLIEWMGTQRTIHMLLEEGMVSIGVQAAAVAKKHKATVQEQLGCAISGTSYAHSAFRSIFHAGAVAEACLAGMWTTCHRTSQVSKKRAPRWQLH